MLKKSTIRTAASGPAVPRDERPGLTDRFQRELSLLPRDRRGRLGPRGDGARLSLPTLGCFLTSLPKASLSSGGRHEARVAAPTSPAGQLGGADSQREPVTATNPRTGSTSTDTQTTCLGTSQGRLHGHGRARCVHSGARAGCTPLDKHTRSVDMHALSTEEPGQAAHPRTSTPRPQMSRHVTRARLSPRCVAPAQGPHRES